MPVRGKAVRRSKSKVTVDFEGVETRVNLPDGEYEFVVDSVEEFESQSGNDGLKWTMKVDEGTEQDGGTCWYYTMLQKESLWNLKSWLEALGNDVDGEMELDLKEYVGQRLIGEVVVEKFEKENGEVKKSAKIVDFWAVPEKKGKSKPTGKGKEKPKDEEEEDEPEEKPARGKGKPAGKGKAKPESEEKENLTQDQISDMDEDELEDIVKEYDLEVDLSKFKTLRKKQTAVVDAAEKADVLESE